MEANPFLKYAQQKTHKLRPSLQCWRFRDESVLKNTIFITVVGHGHFFFSLETCAGSSVSSATHLAIWL